VAVRFIIGRAGTGKTRHCAQALISAMREDPLGPPLIWLVPEQATFNAERMLVTAPEIRGMMRTTVAGFRRLTHLLALELGLSQGTHIDDLGRMILLESLVQQHREALQVFGRVADRPGFIAGLDKMLRELQQNGQTPASLQALAARLGAGRHDAVLRGKLADLALLLGAWQAALADRNLDPDLLHQNVIEQLDAAPLVRGARIWVDAFSAPNLLEIRMLAALGRAARTLEITLLADPDSPVLRGPDDPRVPLDPLSPFYRTERLYRQLRRTFANAGLAVDPPVLLSAAPPPRFAGAADLARVERELFLPEPVAGTAAAPPRGLTLLECANPETEVQAAAELIRQRIARDPGLRYRDIGLIIPNLEAYQDAIRRIFTHHRIPHFIDRRRPITHHPLVELLRTAVALPLGGGALDDLVLLIKTGLTNISEDDANVLENYLLAHGITHHTLAAPFVFAAPNQAEDSDSEPLTPLQRAALERVNAIRETLHGALEPWFALAAAARTPSTPSGAKLTRALFDLLGRFGVEKKMAELMAQARGARQQELFLIHQQAWRQMVHLLETLERTLGGRPTTLADFSRLLSVALEALTLGLIPPTLDEVLVSSVARSRHPELRVALILGALETQFPLVGAEDPLLNDAQRSAFNAAAEHPIGAGSQDDLLASKLLDYVAFTRAHDELIVSYPVADPKGRAVVRSQYVSRLRLLFPALVPQVIAAGGDRPLEQLATAEDLLTTVLQWGRQQITAAATGAAPHPTPTTAAAQDRMAAAYDWLIGAADQDIQSLLNKAWPSLLPVPPPRLDPALAAGFYGPVLRLSVSQLERFGTCPLQYFLHYTLALRPRFVLELEALDIGILYHRILERVYDQIIAGHLDWPACDSRELRQVLEQQLALAAAELHAELQQNAPEYSKMLWRAGRNLGFVLEAQRRAACGSTLRPAATELVFGRRNDAVPTTAAPKVSLPLLVIPTPGGRRAELNGKIDRVDLTPGGPGGAHGVVLDYKSGKGRDLPLREIYYGLALQLPIYLLVLRQHGGQLRPGGIAPGAAFFTGLMPARKTQPDLTKTRDPASDGFYQEVKPQGLIDAAVISELDATVDDDTVKRSAWYKYARTKEGLLSKSGNEAVEHDDFLRILCFTEKKIAAMVDALAAGHIAPVPYRAGDKIPCDRCDFSSTCSFDRIRGDFRELPLLSRAEALEKIRQAVD